MNPFDRSGTPATTRPTSAGTWNYLQHSKDNSAPDRIADPSGPRPRVGERDGAS